MNTQYPLVSVIIATYNSGDLLIKVLEGIKKQTYPQDKIEVILMDGGSTDSTTQNGKKFRCRVLKNPRTEPVFGKYLAYLQAKGEYLMYLDHDEVIQNKDSLAKKVKAFTENHNVKAVIGSGYINPPGYPFINNYINEFGDPFSFFIYRLSKSSKFFLNEMKKKYKVEKETKDYVVFNLSAVASLPIIELVAGGSMFDAKYLKKNFPETKKKFHLLPHYFYLIHENYPFLAMVKNDALLHYSADILKKYFAKIRWRIKNNIYHTSDMGASGFSGRQKYLSSASQLKKLFYIPYAFSLIFPFADALYLVLTRKNAQYFLHVPLTLYTASQILYHYTRKLLGKKEVLKSYDESKIVKV